jgi:hypothetical protein
MNGRTGDECSSPVFFETGKRVAQKSQTLPQISADNTDLRGSKKFNSDHPVVRFAFCIKQELRIQRHDNRLSKRDND